MFNWFKKEAPFRDLLGLGGAISSGLGYRLDATFGAQFQNADAESFSNTSAISGTANYGMTFSYGGSEVFIYGNMPGPAASDAVNWFTGATIPAALSPNTNNLRGYMVYRFPNSTSSAIPLRFTGDAGTDNHIIHCRGTGGSQGYVRGRHPNWRTKAADGDYSLGRRVFRSGGVVTMMSGTSPAINNDSTTRNRVQFMTGSGNNVGNGGAAGGSSGSGGNSSGPGCRGAGGGGGGSQNGNGGAGGGPHRTGTDPQPGSGFAGGQGSGGSNGPGSDGWYGGGGGGRDGGDCSGSGGGGGGSSRVAPGTSETANSNGTPGADYTNYWYLNAPTWGQGRIFGHK